LRFDKRPRCRSRNTNRGQSGGPDRSISVRPPGGDPVLRGGSTRAAQDCRLPIYLTPHPQLYLTGHFSIMLPIREANDGKAKPSSCASWPNVFLDLLVFLERSHCRIG
jgi:hypothetical protein